MTRVALVVVLVASCSWLPPDAPPQKPAPPDPIAHVWKIENHVLSSHASLGDSDALEMIGHTVEITAAGYTSPWHGHCDDAKRTTRERMFASLLTDLDLAGEARETAIRFGFGDPITEYDLTCSGNGRVPTLALYVSGDRAMTCFAGVCYLLLRA